MTGSQTCEFNLRRATSNDAARIAEVDRLSGIIHAPHVPALIDALLVLNLSWIAEAADGRVAGYSVISRRFYSRPFIELLAVNPTFRRRGVGAALLEACRGAFDDATLFTSTNHSNAPMQALLAKAGWRPSGIILDLDPGDPELIYVKPRAP